MALNDGERQVAPTIATIRRDHVARYEWAAGLLKPGINVIDAACGIGYGAHLLAYRAMVRVVGLDRDEETIQYAKKHYRHERAQFVVQDLEGDDPLLAGAGYDAAVCFETIEHLDHPERLLRALHGAAPVLLASVPNEDVTPWRKAYAFHKRHYTQAQFEALLNACGWEVVGWFGQKSQQSEVKLGASGCTLIAQCARAPEGKKPRRNRRADVKTAPGHVAILGMGPSLGAFLEIGKRLGGRHKFCDEVWGINCLGDVFACDRVFHMDDVRIQQIRADARPDSNIAAMLQWMKTHPGPIYTSRTHPDYPGLVAYPLEDVINHLGHAYFNSTAAYAMAYAVHIGVEKITVFGNDFTYANAHDAEKGRACVEFWMGQAAARGIKLSIPHVSSLMDACNTPAERLYGYDTVDVALKPRGDRMTVRFKEKTGPLPTAAEIEHRYDHERHPSPLVDPD